MTDPTAVAQDLQGQILDTIRKSQEAVTDGVIECTASAYDFAEQLLATQRKFAEDILQATAPVLAAKENSGAAPKKGGGAAK